MSESRDMLFLKIAIKNKMLTPEQAEDVLAAVEKRAELGVQKSVAEMAVEKDILTQEQSTQLLTALRSSLPPEQIAGFEILDKIGTGAVGTVYKARQVSLDKVVALKVLHQSLSNHPRFVAQFIREAKTVGRLNHPHIVHAIDAGEEEGYNYFAMEYVDGETLKDRIVATGKLTASQVVDLARSVGQALTAAHQQDLLHRDLKPDNILLGADGQMKVGDFGLAMPLNDAKILAAEHKRVGTPYYISPEQAEGKGIDARSDLYSLGATLYHASTGKPPFTGNSVKEILKKHIHQDAVGPCEAGADIAADLEAVIVKLLAKDPAKRYQSAKEFLAALSQLGAATPKRQQRSGAPRSRAPKTAARKGGAAPARRSPAPRRPQHAEPADSYDEPRQAAARPRGKMGIVTQACGGIGVVISLIFVIMALSKKQPTTVALQSNEEEYTELATEKDDEIIKQRRGAWRHTMDEQEKNVIRQLKRQIATQPNTKELIRGLRKLLKENAHTEAAAQVVAKLDEIDSTAKQQGMSAIDEFFVRAEEQRSRGRLWAAYVIVDDIKPALQTSQEIKDRIDDFLSEVDDEIDRRWDADTKLLMKHRKNKDYAKALEVIEEAMKYAHPDAMKELVAFQAEVKQQQSAFTDKERQKLAKDEEKRYVTLVEGYKTCANGRDFKNCISQAVGTLGDVATDSVIAMVQTDIEAFEMMNNFIKDGLNGLIEESARKDVQLKMKDKRKVKGRVKRIDGERLWVEVSQGGGKAEIPIQIPDITDETIFEAVLEKRGEGDPGYIIPLGVLYLYRGNYPVAKQHFDVAVAGGFSPDTWLDKLTWMKENIDA
ncbi:MAG: protein kinase [Planctomycetota bacterium]